MSSQLECARAMAGMETIARRWTTSDVGFTFAMWAVMMIGMMAPATAPMLLLIAAVHQKRGRERSWPPVAMFALGYAAIWIAAGVIAAMGQWGMHNLALLSAEMAASSPRLAASILIVAGVYQLTALKHRCLVHCRSPLGFLMTNWRSGTLGAFQMGSRHGVYCLGCCWALMSVLFSVGIMNLVWIAVLTAFVLVEKIGPKGTMSARMGGLGLIVFGVVILTRGLFL
jgi:predicted metal-binding membrane protein